MAELTQDSFAPPPWPHGPSPLSWRVFFRIEATVALLVALAHFGLGFVVRGLIFLLLAAIIGLIPGWRATPRPR